MPTNATTHVKQKPLKDTNCQACATATRPPQGDTCAPQTRSHDSSGGCRRWGRARRVERHDVQAEPVTQAPGCGGQCRPHSALDEAARASTAHRHRGSLSNAGPTPDHTDKPQTTQVPSGKTCETTQTCTANGSARGTGGAAQGLGKLGSDVTRTCHRAQAHYPEGGGQNVRSRPLPTAVSHTVIFPKLKGKRKPLRA